MAWYWLLVGRYHICVSYLSEAIVMKYFGISVSLTHFLSVWIAVMLLIEPVDGPIKCFSMG